MFCPEPHNIQWQVGNKMYEPPFVQPELLSPAAARAAAALAPSSLVAGKTAKDFFKQRKSPIVMICWAHHVTILWVRSVGWVRYGRPRVPWALNGKSPCLRSVPWTLQVDWVPRPSRHTDREGEVAAEEHQAGIDNCMLYIVLFQSANSPAPAGNACILVHWSVTNRTTVGTTVMKKTVSWWLNIHLRASSAVSPSRSPWYHSVGCVWGWLGGSDLGKWEGCCFLVKRRGLCFHKGNVFF